MGPLEGESAPLQSWKAIAGYLKVSVRTAQNWERERGLPIRRPPGEKSRVSAIPAELEDWRLRYETAARPFAALLIWRTYSLVASLALLLVCGHEVFQYYRQRAGVPVRFVLESGSLRALDAAGRVNWTRPVPEEGPVAGYAGERSYPRRRIWNGDVNGDGETEVIYATSPERSGPWEMVCLSREGAEQWRRQLPAGGARGGDGQEVVMTDFTARARGGPGGAVFVSLCRFPNHAGSVLALDREGQPVGAVPFPGHAELVRAIRPGEGAEERILVGGFDAGHRQALLMTVDPRRMVEGMRYYFPRSCMNRVLAETNRVNRIECAANLCEIGVEEWFEDRPVEIVYRMTALLESISAWFPDTYRGLHKRLEMEGRLNHTIEQNDASMAQAIRIVGAQ